MFDSRAFRSWPLILAGALGFGALFALVILLADALFEGGFRLSRRVLVFGGGAFAGYVGAAWLVRLEDARCRRRSD
ncbi:MAG: ABC transporter permease [Bacteroidetes bacterium QH_9_67_14]|jgi:hypothetical protein|nr:MAG: ABC transporter permease [Bacteroidetes bacterium QH_9_67_14]